MALINCPECNKEISDKAAACTNCGLPLKQMDLIHTLSPNEDLLIKKRKKHRVVTITISILLISVTAFGIPIYLQNKEEAEYELTLSNISYINHYTLGTPYSIVKSAVIHELKITKDIIVRGTDVLNPSINTNDKYSIYTGRAYANNLTFDYSVKLNSKNKVINVSVNYAR